MTEGDPFLPINKERRKRIAQRITEKGPGFLNNFCDRLPGVDFNIKPGNIPFSRRLRAKMTHMDFDKTYGEQYPPDSPESKGERRHSEFFLNLTPREYYARIDAALLETGVTETTIIRILEVDPDPVWLPLNAIAIPAYLNLIEQGFTWRDLSE